MFITNQYYVLLWQQEKGENYLVGYTTDTQSDYASDNSYTVEYLKDVMKNIICEKVCACTVRSLVAENTFNVKVCTFNFKMIQISMWFCPFC